MDSEIGRLDECARPYASHELVLADQLARSLDQGNKDVQSATADPHGLVGVQQGPLCREQAKGAKQDRARVRRPLNFLAAGFPRPVSTLRSP